MVRSEVHFRMTCNYHHLFVISHLQFAQFSRFKNHWSHEKITIFDLISVISVIETPESTTLHKYLLNTVASGQTEYLAQSKYLEKRSRTLQCAI